MYPLTSSAAPGAVLVDVRDQADRSRDGILPGAVALDAAAVVARLVPGLSTSLSGAVDGAEWLLVSTNGATAAAIASRLRDRGVAASSVEGGFRALTASGADGAGSAAPAYRRAAASIVAHEG
ncbi:rhodanese-like domain-containing protein [Tsukamurella sp. 8F]|uniref:rhodanese-like domain-containing protein n=1 Tax=unclassified Tsukamurella TaxID=2633480 RepID=UPI0023BA01C1|nr:MULTISPECIES: rhodanese-like domain-containing protein [unclassified Tsukamurella]MDF0530909.1 rhodanese-like domain-containing protein [Tsukamurella sp. 8J]MDF0588234.1 rhodanese-like domain-containing protein [Tsukamurella sp. 8F]